MARSLIATTHIAKTVLLGLLGEMACVISVLMGKCPTAISPMATFQLETHTFALTVHLGLQLTHGSAGDVSCAVMGTSQLTTTRDVSVAHLEKLALLVSAMIAVAGQKRTPIVQRACLVHLVKLVWMGSAKLVQTDTGQMLCYPRASSAPAARQVLVDFAQLVNMVKNLVETTLTAETVRTTWSAQVMSATYANQGVAWTACNISAKAAQLGNTVTRSFFMVTGPVNVSTQPTAPFNRRTT